MEDSFFDGYKEEIRDYGVDYARIYEDFTYCPKREVFNCIAFEVDLEDWSLAVPTQFEVWDLLSDPHSFKSKSKCIYWHLIDIKGPKCPWIEENMDIVESCRQIPYLVNDNHGDRDRLFLVIRFVIQRACINRPFVDVDSIPYDPVSDRLMVHLYPHKTVGFSVVEIHFETGPAAGINGRINGLSRIVGGCGNSLDGLAMFIGMNHSFAVSSGFEANCIYFTDSNKHQVLLDSIYGGHDIGIFDYENQTLSTCYYPCDVRSYRRIVPTPVWLTPRYKEPRRRDFEGAESCERRERETRVEETEDVRSEMMKGAGLEMMKRSETRLAELKPTSRSIVVHIRSSHSISTALEDILAMVISIARGHTHQKFMNTLVGRAVKEAAATVYALEVLNFGPLRRDVVGKAAPSVTVKDRSSTPVSHF
ncbi:hypothetical protein STAS_34328 [Striga asiatica]|uniref:KIB1-4 beta-propeller domain-containing protein n=1 Tax=Striga asiatica TaxID=4170 RepID=A0A5A7RHA9_STRAF|nr:hypothetical protein STAS_34328 [Striga asiatica]